jgi:Sulfotransferase family
MDFDSVHPDAPALQKGVQERTGLVDFGIPPLEVPLSVLMRSLAEEANLHRLGRFLASVHIRDLLETRLRLVESWKYWDGLEAEPVQQPIFVTGMPRSGSTFLHELLSLDSSNRAPRVWEVMYPLRKRQAAHDVKSKIRRAETNLWWFRRLAPQADAVHPMRARTPHECVAIHSYTFLSQEFISCFRIPSYEAFLDEADLTPTYAWEKRFLQYLQSGHAPRRWVLKSPEHVRSLEALWKVFPDAVIIQTHRHPLETLVSLGYQTEVLRGMFASPQNRREIGQREAEIMADNMTRIMRFRDAHPELADRFIDVRYQELTAHPEGTLRRIYEKMGMTVADETAGLVRRLASIRGRYSSRRNGHPTLNELGLDGRAVEQQFGDYCSRFEVKRHAPTL